MRQSIDPDLGFEWRPTLWAAGALVFVTATGVVVYSNLRLFGYGAIFAGIVASVRSSHYGNSANNAVVGVVLASVVLVPLTLLSGLFFLLGVGIGDSLFIATSLGLGWVAVVLIVFVPVAYLSAAVTDYLREKLRRLVARATSRR